MVNDKWSIILIGAGNVGYHLGKRLFEKGLHIKQVFSRTKEKAQNLASEIKAEAITDLSKMDPNADLYILAVHDDAIIKTASQLPLNQKLITHTSGSTPSTVLQPYTQRYGIFYPLQTFSISKEVDFEQIPICIHANNKEDVIFLENIAKRISSKVYRINDEQRAILHVAAVFVNNFTNHLFQIGYNILEKENLPFDLLRPLIRETAEKIQEHSPAGMQTGPAVRGDKATIKRHLLYLEKFPEYRSLYDSLTKSIQKS
ncbi:MAG: F420-dependent NADP oxidoreductase [Saprospiraceae bacterium]|nr:F420-dependent NADP oxidoreductase [Saprospiraceae bacterium]